MKTVTMIVTASLLLAAGAEAREKRRVDGRQRSQTSRISEGVKSGELTKGEAAQLRAQQRRVRRTEKRVEADGVVTDKEAARLERKQDRASKNIYRKKHNERDTSDQNTAIEAPAADTAED